LCPGTIIFQRDEELTIGCTSPIFAHHQYIVEVSDRSWRNMGGKKLMWDSFKATSRNSPASAYGFQFKNQLQEVDPRLLFMCMKHLVTMQLTF
jgi:hypothetical protein